MCTASARKQQVSPCLANLNEASNALTHLSSAVESIISPCSSLELSLRQLGEKTEDMPASCRLRLDEVECDLSCWKEVRDTFRLQSRRYWDVGVGKLSEEARKQLDLNEKIESELVIVFLRHCVSRLNAVNETTLRWKETKTFQCLESNIKEIVNEIEGYRASGMKSWYNPFYEFANNFFENLCTVTQVIETDVDTSEDEVQVQSDIEEKTESLVSLLARIRKLIVTLNSATSEVLTCWDVIRSENERESNLDDFEGDLFLTTFRSFLDKLVSSGSLPCVESTIT